LNGNMSAEIVELEERYRGWCTLYVAQVRYPDGHVLKREIEDHGSAVCVLPYDPHRRTTTIIRQLRAPTLHAASEAAIFEAPAGLIDSGEEAPTAARREVMEEIGIQLASLDLVANAWSMPGLSTEKMNLFLATYTDADRIGAGGGERDEGIEVVEMPLRELAAMAEDGRLSDLKTLFLLQALRLRVPELFTPA